LVSGSGLLAAGVRAQAGPLTAKQVVEKIQAGIGVPWKSDTVDTFKAGDPATLVTGIATTALATMDVLQRAVAAKANLIITQEPPFYSKADNGANLANDLTYTQKREFIEKNKLVVWRFSDHWRARKPDGNLIGLEASLGWTKYGVKGESAVYKLPGTTLGNLVKDIQKKLKLSTIRVIGDPKMRPARVSLLPAFTPLGDTRRMLAASDVVVVGKVYEWEGVEYAQDAVSAGWNKAMVILGLVASVDPGMNECAKWVRSVVPSVPVTFVPTGDPYWRPKA